jgi:hypothetical protein
MASDLLDGSALATSQRADGAVLSQQAEEASKGFLHVRAYKGKPFYEARWRDLKQTQRRRRLGAAWVEFDSAGKWVAQRGRVRRG